MQHVAIWIDANAYVDVSPTGIGFEAAQVALMKRERDAQTQAGGANHGRPRDCILARCFASPLRHHWEHREGKSTTIYAKSQETCHYI